jgi:hypothetical protein
MMAGMGMSGKRTAKKRLQETEIVLDEFVDLPHGEEQQIIDRLEAPVFDEDYDFVDPEDEDDGE